MPTDVRGIGRAKRLVRDYLELELPDTIAAYNELHELEVAEPASYRDAEPQAIDAWPLLAVVGVRTASIDRLNAGEEVTEIHYQTTYSLRTYVWCRSQGWDATVAERDDLAACVRLALLDRPALRVDDDVAVVNENTVTEEYSDVEPLKGDRFLAGAFIAFDVRVAEVIARAPLGTVSATELGIVPAHPALD